MDEYEREGLAFVNKVRAEMGEKPLDALVPGKPRDACACVIATSIGVGDITVEPYFGGDSAVSIETDDGFVDFNIPPEAAHFARRFDEGLYPELIRA